ncbi:MAG: flagellar hook capping FlgD N-terminal domain-containing protein [Pseudomonadota bacterium]
MSTAITSTSATDGASASSSTGAIPKNTLGKDDFLKIFLAQLSQQDPTAPVDSQAFVAQLAQFSTLELQQNANQDLEALMMGQAAAQQTGVTSLVGKDIVYKTDSVTLAAGQGATLGATLGADSAAVSAVVSDAHGKTVRTLSLGARAAGPTAIAWDGRDDAGNPLPAGTYKVDVRAADRTGAAVTVSQTATGQVNGVSFAGGSTQLMVGSTTVSLSDVTQITERTTP